MEIYHHKHVHSVAPVGVCIRELLWFYQQNADSTELTLILSNFNFGTAATLKPIHQFIVSSRRQTTVRMLHKKVNIVKSCFEQLFPRALIHSKTNTSVMTDAVQCDWTLKKHML